MKDILFKTEDQVFSFRVGGILIREGKALLQRQGEDYAIVGGHVSAMETSAQALMREFEEELHARIQVQELLAVGELFFPWGKRRCHQICLYYRIEMERKGDLPWEGVFHGFDELDQERVDLEYVWVPIAELKNLAIYPPQIVSRIENTTLETTRFVYVEE